MSSLLEIRHLSVEFATASRVVRAVDDVSLDLARGETLGLVGESGSGKSVTALSVARLVPSPPGRYAQGEVSLAGREVLGMPAAELRRVRGGVVSYVFQEPGASLNPVRRVGSQILETLQLHRLDAAHDDEVIRLLKWVGLSAPEQRRHDYPHQMSGGMQQRVMIAMALASRPKLLVADEPTTALDVTIQAQILDLLRDLKTRRSMSILLITHSLGLLRDLADRVAVMYAGQIVELAPVPAVLRQPRHPYTRALIQSVPVLGRPGHRLSAIPGQAPASGAFPAGCRFHPRCARAEPNCARQAPELRELEPGWWVRCPLATPLAHP